jgi:SNF2 family DNA or RNA helicase
LYAAKKLAVMFDLPMEKIVAPDSFKDYTRKAFPKGGILADEMGLGYAINN